MKTVKGFVCLAICCLRYLLHKNGLSKQLNFTFNGMVGSDVPLHCVAEGWRGSDPGSTGQKLPDADTKWRGDAELSVY